MPDPADSTPLAESELSLAPAAATAEGPVRLPSLDAYRGFVMLAMASGGLGFGAMAARLPESQAWAFLKGQTDHVDWRGCSAWDLIQPSFMFIVGVAMPWAYANRKARGEGWWDQFGHAIGRSVVLVALGVFLSSSRSPQTNWTFMNVLTQIGLGYPFVFLVLGWRPAWQWAAVVAVLAGYWAYFGLWPLPGSGGTWPVRFDSATILDHWARNANAASEFDLRFLNLLPYPDGKGFGGNPEGYATLNFVPSIATAILGVLAGRLLRSGRSARGKLAVLVVLGLVGIGVGTAMGYTVCPVVKKVWSPSWVLVSGGWASLLLAAFYLVVDVAGWRRLASPMVVVGANSIAMYVMAQLLKPWARQTIRTHGTTLTYVLDHWLGLGPALVPQVEPKGPLFGGTYGPIGEQAAILLLLWLVCLWLYRRRIFIRV